MELLGLKSEKQFATGLMKELSLYATAYTDGREIIAESFSGYYSKAGNMFADAFVSRCIELKEAMGDSEMANVTNTKHGGDTMRVNDEAIYWMRNEDWFTVDETRDCLLLTPQAPQRAIESFRLYLQRNNLPTEPMELRGDQMGRPRQSRQAVGI